MEDLFIRALQPLKWPVAKKGYTILAEEDCTIKSCSPLFISNNPFGEMDNKKENPFGFSDGGSYRIVNVGDSSVIELVGNILMCRPRSEDPDRVIFQTFDCRVTETGDYEIACRYQKSSDTKMVWDFLPHRGALIQRRQAKSVKGTQKWKSQQVPTTVCTYFVLKAPEGTHCIKNMGLEEQVQVVQCSENMSNPCVYWKLELINPILKNEPSVPAASVKPTTPVEPKPSQEPQPKELPGATTEASPKDTTKPMTIVSESQPPQSPSTVAQIPSSTAQTVPTQTSAQIESQVSKQGPSTTPTTQTQAHAEIKQIAVVQPQPREATVTVKPDTPTTSIQQTPVIAGPSGTTEVQPQAESKAEAKTETGKDTTQTSASSETKEAPKPTLPAQVGELSIKDKETENAGQIGTTAPQPIQSTGKSTAPTAVENKSTLSIIPPSATATSAATQQLITSTQRVLAATISIPVSTTDTTLTSAIKAPVQKPSVPPPPPPIPVLQASVQPVLKDQCGEDVSKPAEDPSLAKLSGVSLEKVTSQQTVHQPLAAAATTPAKESSQTQSQ